MTRGSLIVMAVVCAGALVGCQPGTSTPTTITPTSTVTEVVEPTTEASEGDSRQESEQARQCAEGRDVHTSDAASLLRSRQAAVPGQEPFSFVIDQNFYNPCLDLSWVLLSGARGDNRTAYSLLLFSGNQMIVDLPPVLEDAAPQVKRVADNELEVTRGGKAIRVKVENGEVSTQPEGWPTVPALELANPRGVVPRDVVAQEPLYRLPLGPQHNLFCEISGQGPVYVDCDADFPTTWKMRTNDPNPPQAVRVTYRVKDGSPEIQGLAQRHAPEASAALPDMIPAGETTNVQGVQVDLGTPGEVVMRFEKSAGADRDLPALKISADSYELVR